LNGGFASWSEWGILVFDNLRAACGIPEVDPPAMSTSQVLQHLYSLDISSQYLLRYLYCLIQHDEEEQYLSSLQGPELSRLVEFLDKVRVLPPYSARLRSRSCRLSGPSPPPTMFSDNVYTNCKPSVATI